jgi:uncharacterized repeat protein (TIGR03803 family)
LLLFRTRTLRRNILRNKSFAVFALIVLVAVVAHASTETVLWNFSNSNGDGSAPWSNFFISDSKGNLYGVTGQGGTYSAGMVFELSPHGSGGYNETILYEFKGSGNGDGSTPYGGLVFKKGSLFGTTQGGGANGVGTVYKLSPKSGGGWTEKVIYSFSGTGGDGQLPAAGVVIGKNGVLYGTTSFGGANSSGTVFQLTKTTKGWSEKVIHSFGASGDGSFPYGGLMLDALGNLYGTTSIGGAAGFGTVYQLTFTNKAWTETLLYSFTNANGDGGGLYYVNLISDKAGNLYGTTAFGGINNTGTVWELMYSKTKKTYSERVLYTFGVSGGSDGIYPYGGVVMGKPGTLYGTTEVGGSNPNGGTVYELKKSGKTWTESILHNFAAGSDGQDPSGNLLRDAQGNLFGMAQFGGTSNDGIVYEVTP